MPLFHFDTISVGYMLKQRIMPTIRSIFLIALIVGGILFVTTSLIPRRGSYVVNGTRLGDSAYRDVRGIPFVFLKRSLADGECDIQDVQIRVCDPAVGNEPHHVSVGFAIADLGIWVSMAWAIGFAGYLLYTKRHSPATVASK